MTGMYDGISNVSNQPSNSFASAAAFAADIADSGNPDNSASSVICFDQPMVASSTLLLKFELNSDVRLLISP